MSIGSSKSPSVQRSAPQSSAMVPQPMEAPQAVEIIKEVIREIPTEHHHHYTKHEVKTRDSRARNYAKALKESLEKSHKKSVNGLNVRMDVMSKHIKQLEARKPEEKRVLTVETRHTETIKEVSTAMDKRMLLLLALSTALNVALILLK